MSIDPTVCNVRRTTAWLIMLSTFSNQTGSVPSVSIADVILFSIALSSRLLMSMLIAVPLIVDSDMFSPCVKCYAMESAT